MNRIFYLDLDGTLLNDTKTITPLTRAAINDWLNNGNYLALSSGRPLNSVKEVASKEKLFHENIYLIGFNGAVIYHPFTDKIIAAKVLSKSDAVFIAKEAAKRNIYNHSYDDESILTGVVGKEIEYYTKTIHLPVKKLDNYPDGIPINPYKVLCIELENIEKLEEFKNFLNNNYGDKFCAVKSHANLLEIFPSNSGKGQAVIDFADFLNIDIKDTLAAGDEQNDLSMLQAAGISIAMLNGKEELKKEATFITETDNNNDGLLPFLKKYQ